MLPGGAPDVIAMTPEQRAMLEAQAADLARKLQRQAELGFPYLDSTEEGDIVNFSELFAPSETYLKVRVQAHSKL